MCKQHSIFSLTLWNRVRKESRFHGDLTSQVKLSKLSRRLVSSFKTTKNVSRDEEDFPARFPGFSICNIIDYRV